MSIYHLSVKIYSRGNGDAIIAAAAYIGREKLHDLYYGLTHSFTQKHDLIYSRIHIPPNAPVSLSDKGTLWNVVEKSEGRKNSRLARGIKMALPIELSHEEHIRITESYVIANFVEKGMIADVAIHDKGDGNPHVHILLTTRNVSKNGFGGKNRDWNKRELLNEWRREWANVQNHELELKGLEPVSHECYAVQDFECAVERIPNKHLGHIVQKLDRSGIETDRMKEYREITKSKLKLELEQKRERRRSRGRGR